MVQKIHPGGVIWVPISRLMWENQLKKLTAVLSIYKEVHKLGQGQRNSEKVNSENNYRELKMPERLDCP